MYSRLRFCSQCTRNRLSLLSRRYTEILNLLPGRMTTFQRPVLLIRGNGRLELLRLCSVHGLPEPLWEHPESNKKSCANAAEERRLLGQKDGLTP